VPVCYAFARVTFDPGEAAFRAHMRTLARKGGAVTKQRHGCDPRYYRNIGRRGGHASVEARKARIAAELGGVKPGEAPIIEASAALAEAPITEPIDMAPETHATARRPVNITELLADRKRFGPRQPEVSERQRILDAIAEDHLARVIAGVYDANEPEPWDPWS
jgi:general stress protein YciG